MHPAPLNACDVAFQEQASALATLASPQAAPVKARSTPVWLPHTASEALLLRSSGFNGSDAPGVAEQSTTACAHPVARAPVIAHARVGVPAGQEALMHAHEKLTLGGRGEGSAAQPAVLYCPSTASHQEQMVTASAGSEL